MKKIRVGVIGTGYLGQFHAEKYAAHPDVDLVAVVDADNARACAVAGKCGSSACGCHADLSGRVDAVSVVTPTPTHFEIGRYFLDQGVDVLMEKPITVNLSQADTLIELADRKGLVLQVGHLERFNPAVIALSEKVKAPFYIDARRMSVFKPRAADTSVILDLMIHDIDLVSSLVNSPVKNVSATGARMITDKPDLAAARITYENGAVADIAASRVALADDRRMSVFCKDVWCYVDFVERSLKTVRPGNPRHETVTGALTFDKADALAAEIGAFVESIKTRKQPLVTGRVGREALATALMVSDLI